MPFFPASLENLIDKFASLPGIGRKSAQRLAFHVLSLPEGEGESFANAILEARKNVCCCKICQNLTEGEVCSVCASTKRDKSIVCVVSEPRDVLSIERAMSIMVCIMFCTVFSSPISHVGPDDIRISELIHRVAADDSEIKEIIMATNPDTEGEADCHVHIKTLLKPFDVKVTRLAYGIPVGSNLEFADDATLFALSKAELKCDKQVIIPVR